MLTGEIHGKRVSRCGVLQERKRRRGITVILVKHILHPEANLPDVLGGRRES